jgi:hypothetical protein
VRKKPFLVRFVVYQAGYLVFFAALFFLLLSAGVNDALRKSLYLFVVAEVFLLGAQFIDARKGK